MTEIKCYSAQGIGGLVPAVSGKQEINLIICIGSRAYRVFKLADTCQTIAWSRNRGISIKVQSTRRPEMVVG